MDELTRLTIRVIALETAIEKLNKITEKLPTFNAYIIESLERLEARIKVLEDARQRQIAFNSTVQIKEPVKTVEIKPLSINNTSKFKWPWK